MKYVQSINEVFDIKAQYLRDENGNYNSFYNAGKLDNNNQKNSDIKIKNFEQILKNLRNSLKLIEDTPVVDWFEEPINFHSNLYNLKEEIEKYIKLLKQNN